MITKIILSAFKDIWVNKMRSLLTVLGILVGISSVTMMVSIGESAQSFISESLVSKLGKNLVMVMPGEASSSGGFALSPSAFLAVLGDEDYQAILRAKLHEIDKISRRQTGSFRIKYYDITDEPIVAAVDSTFSKIISVELQAGRFFRDSDSRAGSKSVIIDRVLAKKLFKLQDPIGRTVQMEGTDFQVIGVVEDLSGQSMMGGDTTTVVYVLIDVYRATFNKPAKTGALYITVKDNTDIVAFKSKLEKIVRKSHNLLPSEKSDFSISTQSDIIETSNSILGTVTLFISVISSISLIVGGIGVMNIMLVSVKERVKEIGLRKALGATNSDIRRQILVESVLFSLIGGVLGIIVGATGAAIIQSFGGLPFFISISAIASALGVSSVIGLVFGLYPAIQAGKLSPIEALRSN